jgi:hypothetical protein
MCYRKFHWNIDNHYTSALIQEIVHSDSYVILMNRIKNSSHVQEWHFQFQVRSRWELGKMLRIYTRMRIFSTTSVFHCSHYYSSSHFLEYNEFYCIFFFIWDSAHASNMVSEILENCMVTHLTLNTIPPSCSIIYQYEDINLTRLIHISATYGHSPHQPWWWQQRRFLKRWFLTQHQHS